MRKRLLLLFVVMLLFFAMLGHNVTLIRKCTITTRLESRPRM